LPGLTNVPWAQELRHLLSTADGETRAHLTLPIKVLFADEAATGTASLRPLRGDSS